MMVSSTGRRVVPAAILQDRLIRTAIPLMINTASNAVLGAAFWVVAARHYGTTSLAQNLAVVAAMTTLSGICQLNLGPTFSVLVPRAGVHGRRVVLEGYAAATGMAALAVPVFVFLVLPHLSRLHAVLDQGGRLPLFALAVVVFNIFSLQDAALISLRRGRWIPVENTSFGVVKLILLLVFASAFPGIGIFASWVVGMLLVIPVVSGYVLARRPPHHPAALQDAPSMRDSLPRVLLDYAGYLCLVSSTFFLPVVALELLPRKDAALFAVAWLTTSTIDLLATNLGTALTVETTYGVRKDLLRRTVQRRALPLIGAISLLTVLLAPLLLHVYGASGGTGVTTLQVLGLAILPRAVVTLSVAAARAAGDIGYVFRLRAQNAVICLGLAVLLAPVLGAPGMGLAWLVSQLIGAATALVHGHSQGREVPEEVLGTV
jgi:O-antigen/teichoic acid export membrane protein